MDSVKALRIPAVRTPFVPLCATYEKIPCFLLDSSLILKPIVASTVDGVLRGNEPLVLEYLTLKCGQLTQSPSLFFFSQSEEYSRFGVVSSLNVCFGPCCLVCPSVLSHSRSRPRRRLPLLYKNRYRGVGRRAGYRGMRYLSTSSKGEEFSTALRLRPQCVGTPTHTYKRTHVRCSRSCSCRWPQSLGRVLDGSNLSFIIL